MFCQLVPAFILILVYSVRCDNYSSVDIFDPSAEDIILPNLRMFSTVRHIFYRVDSGAPVQEQYTKNIPGTDLLTKGFGYIPCSCHHQLLECACCAYVKFERFNFQRTACSNLTINKEELNMDVSVNYNGYTLANRSLSLRHPPPFCIPTPQIPALLSCIRVHDITVKDGTIEMCINFELKVVAIQNPIFVLEFTCVEYGPDGLILERPSVVHHPLENSTLINGLGSTISSLFSSTSNTEGTTAEGTTAEATTKADTKRTTEQDQQDTVTKNPEDNIIKPLPANHKYLPKKQVQHRVHNKITSERRKSTTPPTVKQSNRHNLGNQKDEKFGGYLMYNTLK